MTILLPAKGVNMVKLFSWSLKSALFLSLIFVAGCLQPITVPIETIRYEAPDGQAHRLLFVFLPGNGDPITVFQEEGLVKAVRQRGLPADMIAVNAHIGYYRNGTVLTRLKEDVIGPAIAKGYEQIWLVGNSLGGYGSLSYAREYPDDVTGVVLLGPFLGPKSIVDKIKRAGGILQWTPAEVKLKSEDEWDKHLWLWIKDRVQQKKFSFWTSECEQKGCNPRVYLGYGRGDRFSYGQEFLASLMPPEQVIIIDGGHDWTTWTKLWNLFLDRNIFSIKPHYAAAPYEVKK
jgi:pimeloyl-ACP methyl ester carboxylesterase